MCVCVYVLDRATLAGRQSTVTASCLCGEKQRWTVKVKRRLRDCKRHRAGSPHTDGHQRERGPGSCFEAAALEHTQPWLTSRSKGSSGSSKKFSKAKRCGNVTSYFFLLRFSSFFVCYNSVLMLSVCSRYDRDPKITSAIVRSHSCVAAGQA